MSKVKIYVETSPEVYELLDLYDDENINISYKLKDSGDLAKAFSIYSQTFSIPADKNNRKLDFYFNTKVSRNTELSIRAKIYVGTQLFKVGNIVINKGKMKQGKINSYSITFTTALKSLKDVVGDKTINQLDTDASGTYTGATFLWYDQSVYDEMTNNSGGLITIPTISTERVWTFGDNGPNDIKFASGSTSPTNSAKYIDYRELRPAIPFSYVMDRIANNFGYEFVIPMVGERAYDRLMIHLIGEQTSSIAANIEYNVPFTRQTDPLLPSPFVYNWSFSGTSSSSGFVYELSKLVAGTLQYGNIEWTFTPEQSFSLAPLENFAGKITYIDERTATAGQVLYTQEFKIKMDPANVNTPITISTPFTNNTLGDRTLTVPASPGNPLRFRVLLELAQAALWDDGNYGISVYETGNFTHYWHRSALSQNVSINTGKIALLKLLPNIKIVDFLSTFVKLFNLRIRQDNTNSNILNWESPKEWANKTLDYTRYADIESYDVEPTDLFKDYDFKHKTSKNFSNVNFAIANASALNGKEFGELALTISGDTLKGSYKIETSSSITPEISISPALTSSYGFASDNPTASTKYGSLYKPNVGELKLLYRSGTLDLGAGYTLAFKIGDTKTEVLRNSRVKLSDVNMGYMSYQFFNALPYSNALPFKDEIDIAKQLPYDKNLYTNYYSDVISRLNAPNTRIKTITCWLPSIEITNFDLRNKIIIGEEIHSIEEAAINITTGKVNMKLMNFNEPNAGVKFDTNASTYTADVSTGGRRMDLLGFDSTYKIAKYEIKVDGVLYPDIVTPEKYFYFLFGPSEYNKYLSVTIVDIFGNRSSEELFYLFS